MPTTCPFTIDKRAACEQYSGCCPQGLGPIEGGGGGGDFPLGCHLGKYSSNRCLLAAGGSSGSGVGANSSFSSSSSSDSDLITWSGFTNSVMTLTILSTASIKTSALSSVVIGH